MKAATGSDRAKRLGILWGILCAVSLGFMNLLVKLSAGQFPASQVVFVRGLVGVLILTPFVFRKTPALFTREGTILWIRFLGGSFALLTLFYNLQEIGVGDATALFNLSTLFVVIFSWLLLKDPLSHFELLAIGLIILGAMILQSPFGSSIPWQATAIGVTGAVFAGIGYIALRQAAQRFSPFVVVWGFCIFNVIVSFMLPNQTWVMPQGPQYPLLISVGILGLMGQIWMTYSYMHLPAALACALSLSSLIWGLTFESIYFMTLPKPTAFLSYALIIGGVYILQTQHKVSNTNG